MKLSVSWKKYFSQLLSISSLVFMGVITFREFYNPTNNPNWKLQFFSDPLFDQTATNDHLINFLAVLFFFGLIAYQKKNFFIALLICSFIYTFNEALVELFVTQNAGTDWFYTATYSVILGGALFLWFKKRLELLIYFMTQIFIYSYWNLMQIPWDCKGHWTIEYCMRYYSYYFDPLTNFFIILVWIGDFVIGYSLLS